jgi:hypothetical protein
VRLDRAIPKAPRLIRGRRLQKIGKVAGIVAVPNRLRRRRQLFQVERLACHQPRLSRLVVRDSRAPAFRRLPDRIAVLGYGLGVRLEFRWEKADMVARRLQLPRIPARQQARS